MTEPTNHEPAPVDAATESEADGAAADAAVADTAVADDAGADDAQPGLDGGTYEVPPRPEQTEEQEQLAIEVEDRMYDVVDPELGVNVVDLGLVYDIWMEGTSTAVINMTLTSPACPLTDMLFDQAETMVLDHPRITDMRLNWVWSPPWGPQMITEDGRDQMRALGFSV